MKIGAYLPPGRMCLWVQGSVRPLMAPRHQVFQGREYSKYEMYSQRSIQRSAFSVQGCKFRTSAMTCQPEWTLSSISRNISINPGIRHPPPLAKGD